MSLFGTGRKEGIGAVLVLIALVIVQHAPSWWGVGAGETGSPFVQGLEQAAAAVRAGSWPSWNPLSGDGSRFAASGVARFYPPYWPLAFGWTTLAWICVAHAALAAALTYRMLRALAASRYSAFLGGGLYAMGWFLTCAWSSPREAFAACWLPWIVTCAWNLLFPRRRATSAVLLGAALTAPFLTGGTATAALGVALGGLCVVAGLFRIDRVDRGPTVAAAASALALAFLFTAPLWVPWLSAGAQASPTTADGPIPIAGLLGLASPDLFGESGSSVPDAIRAARDGAPDVAFALYPGGLVFLVALLGLLRPKRTWIPLFWICVAGLALVLVIEHPLTRAVHVVAPFLTEHPAAPLAVFHLGVVVLLALGLENFFDAPRARPLALPTASVTLLLLVGAATATLLLADPATLTASEGPEEWLDRMRLTAPRVLMATAALALVFLTWQRHGVLRLKQLVAVLALGEVLILGLAHHAKSSPLARSAAGAPLAGSEPIEPGAAPPGSGPADPYGGSPRFAFVERTRDLDHRPTIAEVRASRDVLVEGSTSGCVPSRGLVEVVTDRPDRTVLRFEPANEPRLLLLRRTHDVGWVARDGRGEAALLRADRTHAAVVIPAGADSLSLTYREPGLALGLALAAFGSVLALGLLTFRRR
ncbi:MAG: hypothetical protein O2865_13840 [Planctomycetota bacterium]|nr:hypothetical protein [Planctomycetota bacterium]MDA0934618.1 hypothetical protein [Planctomycetota bacterium]MDA1221266.1 hypothetical protein [Planctomycetota bacterium]